MANGGADLVVEVGANDAHVATGLARGGLPLNAHLRGFVGIHFGNQALHHHLRAALVEHINHGTQLTILRFGRGDDERVGRGVRLNLPASGRACWRIGSTHGAARCSGGCSHWVGVAQCVAAIDARGLPTDRSTQGGGQFGGIRIFQIHHMDIAAGVGAARLIQFGHQRLHQRHARGVGSTQDEGVAAWLSQ